MVPGTKITRGKQPRRDESLIDFLGTNLSSKKKNILKNTNYNFDEHKLTLNI